MFLVIFSDFSFNNSFCLYRNPLIKGGKGGEGLINFLRMI